MIDSIILKGLMKPYISNWDCVKLLNIRFLIRCVHFFRIKRQLFVKTAVGVKKRSKDIYSQRCNKLKSYTLIYNYLVLYKLARI